MRFGEIFIDEAKRSKLSLEEYELRTMSPSSVLNSAKNPNTKTPAGLMILSLLDGTVKDYINWYVSTQMSASCGDTSGFLDRMTSRLTDVKRGKLETVKTNTFLNQIIFNMISATKRWYCRCTLDVHSFFIECVNRKAVVYQSYFGKYPLSHSIKNLTEWNRKEFIPLLEAAVHNDTTLTCLKFGYEPNFIDELSEKRRLELEKEYQSLFSFARKGKPNSEIDQIVYIGRKGIFHGAAPMHKRNTVDIRFNKNPAPEKEIRNNLRRALLTYKDEWSAVRNSQQKLSDAIT